MRRLNDAVIMHEEPAYLSSRAENVMALTIAHSKTPGLLRGIVREIVDREGDVEYPGYVDTSELFHVESLDGLNWKPGDVMRIRGIDEIVESVRPKGGEFLGLEDPDVYFEEGLYHLYFTMPFVKDGGGSIHLGHAQGRDLNSLVATEPVLSPERDDFIAPGYKEVSILPAVGNSRMALAESGGYDEKRGVYVSTIAAANVPALGSLWKPRGVVANPAELGVEWAGEHISPGPIIDNYKGLLLGIANGRSPSRIEGERRVYGKFSVGLMMVDPRTGEIPWVSEKPFISDPDAKTITFASDCLRIGEEKKRVYAHVDDSFIRAYDVDLVSLKRDFVDDKS